MKKLITLLFVAAILISMVACNNAGDNAVINPGIVEYKDPYAEAGEGEEGIIEVDPGAKTALNPLTGLYNMAVDRVGERPIAVSVNNYIHDSWPQFGTSKADYILEIVTEGGITRLFCLYSDTREVDKIGSIRSLRDQFLEAIYPLDPLIIHIGTSIYADRAMAQYNFRTLNTGQVTPAMWTDTERALKRSIEHCKFVGGKSIEKGIEVSKIPTKSNSNKTAFDFLSPDDTAFVPDGGSASAVHYFFSDNKKFDGDFRYDSASEKYLKWQNGNPQIDAGNNDQQLQFDNVILLFTDISVIPGEEKEDLQQVDFKNGGEGYYFTKGNYIKITWEKGDYQSNFVFKDEDGNDIKINVGVTHMGVTDKKHKETLVITP